MAERGTVQRSASALDSVEDWIARRNADVQRLTRDAEAAGREAWGRATRVGENLVAARPADVLALGVRVLDDAKRRGGAGGSRPATPTGPSISKRVRDAAAAGVKAGAGKAVLYAGEGLGLINGLGSSVKGAVDGALFIEDLTDPAFSIGPRGDAARKHLADLGVGVGDYIRKGVANPSGVVGDVQNGIRRFEEDTNPDATPVADTVSEEVARNFRIGRNRGKFAFDAGTFLVGGEGLKGLALVGGASKEALIAKYLEQGLSQEAAEHLAAPYPSSNMGHHFVQRRTKVPESILGVPVPKFAVGLRPPTAFMESPLNVLKPRNLSRGEFYKLHYEVDPSFYGAKLPGQGPGGGWSGKALGLQKHDLLGRLWHGSPAPLKATAGGLTAAGRSYDSAEQWGHE